MNHVNDWQRLNEIASSWRPTPFTDMLVSNPITQIVMRLFGYSPELRCENWECHRVYLLGVRERLSPRDQHYSLFERAVLNHDAYNPQRRIFPIGYSVGRNSRRAPPPQVGTFVTPVHVFGPQRGSLAARHHTGPRPLPTPTHGNGGERGTGHASTHGDHASAMRHRQAASSSTEAPLSTRYRFVTSPSAAASLPQGYRLVTSPSATDSLSRGYRLVTSPSAGASPPRGYRLVTSPSAAASLSARHRSAASISATAPLAARHNADRSIPRPTRSVDGGWPR